MWCSCGTCRSGTCTGVRPPQKARCAATSAPSMGETREASSMHKRATKLDLNTKLRKAHIHVVKRNKVNSLVSRNATFSDWWEPLPDSRISYGSSATGTSSIKERREAEILLHKLAQEDPFVQDIQKLKLQRKLTLKKHKKLYKWNAFLDKNNVLRVRGQLSHSALHYDMKHPAILSRKSHVSALLLKHYHKLGHHQRRGMTLNEFRAKGIWILECGSVVSSHIYKCVKCRRYRRSTEVEEKTETLDNKWCIHERTTNACSHQRTCTQTQIRSGKIFYGSQDRVFWVAEGNGSRTSKSNRLWICNERPSSKPYGWSSGTANS